MKLSKTCLSLFAALAGSLSGTQALAHDMVPGKAAEGPLLLTGLTIHTVTDGVKTDSDILIVDGKIAAVGQNLSAPQGATVLALDGKHLYPGLIALANQLGLIEIEAVRSTDDSREVTQTNPDIKAKVGYNADSEVIPTIRSNGFAYSMIYPYSDNFLDDQFVILRLGHLLC